MSAEASSPRRCAYRCDSYLWPVSLECCAKVQGMWAGCVDAVVRGVCDFRGWESVTYFDSIVLSELSIRAYLPNVRGQLILSPLSACKLWWIRISVTRTSHISDLHSERVNHSVANLVNLPVYSLVSGITLFRAHGEGRRLSRVLLPASVIFCLHDRIFKAFSSEGAGTCFDSSASGSCGWMVW